MSGLVEKLEAAEVGSRELDAAVAQCLDIRPDWLSRSEGRLAVYKGQLVWLDKWVKRASPGSPSVECEPITTSLDAALSLAERIVGEDEALWLLKGIAVDAEEDTVNGCIKLLPLRLCVALLKSRRALNLNETRHAE